jgi:hypothetical protein
MPVDHVRPAFVVVAQPMLLEPPLLTKRPVWNVATTVVPYPNESGSTWVRCWLDEFMYGSELIGVAITLPPDAAAAVTSTAAAHATAALNLIAWIVFLADASSKTM